MADALLRPYETKNADFDNLSSTGDWADLYSPQHIDTGYDNVEDMPKINSIITAYIRKSSGKQSSTEMQIIYCKTKAKQMGIKEEDIVWFIEDEDGVSATKKPQLTDRPKGTELHELVSNGEVEIILCYKLDRLFRQQWAAHSFIGLCQERGTDVFSTDCTQGVLSDEGFLLYSVQFMMAEMYARDLARKTSDGMSATRQKGQATTHAVFGWDILVRLDEFGNKETKVIPNWQEQAVLYWIKQQQIKGWSNNKIAKALNEIGVRGKSGGKFQSSSVKRMLEAKQHMMLSHFNTPKRMMKWPFTALRNKQSEVFDL